MYYTPMQAQDIVKHSRSFLYAIYQKYPNRACENLGVSSSEEETDLSEEEYPSEFKKFSKNERQEYIENSGITDEEFLAQFQEFEKH